MIYFIQAGEDGPVKIGVAEDPAARLGDLQTAHYELLTIIRLVEGGRAMECAFHAAFSSRRIRREWFHFHPRMLSLTVAPIVEKPITPVDLVALSASFKTALRLAGSGQALAEYCHVTRQTIHNWKHGQFSRLTPLVLAKFLRNPPPSPPWVAQPAGRAVSRASGDSPSV